MSNDVEARRRRRSKRRLAGFATQDDLAKELGYHLTTISDIERGRYTAPPWWDAILDAKIEIIRLKKKVSRLQKLIQA